MKKIICVLLVLVMMLSLTACGANGSYKSVVKTMTKAMEKCDAEKMIKIFPDELMEILCEEEYDDDYDDMVDDLEDSLKDSMDWWEDQYGRDIKLSYEIDDADELDEDELEELMDMYDDYMDVDLDIKKGYEVEVEMTIEGKDDDDSEDMVLTIIKVGSKWYIDIMSFDLF